MAFIIQWVTEIVIFLLLAMVIDFLLPSGQMQKYARLAISLILVLIFLNPLFRLFNTDVNQLIQTQAQTFSTEIVKEEALKKSVETKKSEIQATQDAYILEQMVVQMKSHAEERLAQDFTAEIMDITFLFKDEVKDLEHLETVQVSLKEAETVESIEHIDIDLDKPAEEKDEQTNEAIVTYLAELWQLDQDRITIQWEGANE
ncbi:stage III sporulation protein AF [Thalassobacillus devorans]|uniref:Stage III sporulation protein AF n=1 Tax=Thalassobacillus devorans TaxID=279813 RepID=A0ABQ1P5A2_9BACI|nr:stage III sporulation protein AF [Thalassobacillus devorans]NIK29602.1 stage III sporulation protein AF [Thalassobacillus devorans]GGC91375.1 stage III sporulation protein AF [Thalassobacillus devorans]